MACQAAPATLKSAFLEPVRAVGGCLRVGAACSSCAAAILVTSRISPLHPSALPLLLLHPRRTPAWCIPTPSVQVAAQLSAELAVEMCGRKDEDFMGLFTGRTSSLARGLFCAAAAAAISALIWAWRDAAGARQRPQPPASPGRSALPPSQPASRPPPLVPQRRACCRRWRPAATRWPSGWRAWCAARTSSRQGGGGDHGLGMAC